MTRRARGDFQDYSNQRYIGSMLDETYFIELTSHTDILYVHGAMDAPEFMPAGSMVSLECGKWYDRSVVERGVSLKEQEERDAYLLKLFKEMGI